LNQLVKVVVGMAKEWRSDPAHHTHTSFDDFIKCVITPLSWREELQLTPCVCGRDGIRAWRNTTQPHRNLKSKDALRLVRIISHYLNLANVADQHNIMRLMRKHQFEEDPLPYTFHHVFDTLTEAGVSKDDIYGTLSLLVSRCRCRSARSALT
jgi:hypothetical protein